MQFLTILKTLLQLHTPKLDSSLRLFTEVHKIQLQSKHSLSTIQNLQFSDLFAEKAEDTEREKRNKTRQESSFEGSKWGKSKRKNG